MSAHRFHRATKEQGKLRLALIGPAGSGKTWTALSVAEALGGRVAVIDTEHGSASKYADRFRFETTGLASFSPQEYTTAIEDAGHGGFGVLVIDSLSHAWVGRGGALEMHDDATVKARGNSYVAWRDVTPHHNALVEAMLQSPAHVIVTMRAKTDYVMEKHEQTGKTIIRKVGLAAIQRDGLEYEFDVVGMLDMDNTLCVVKSRCSALHGAVLPKPGMAFGQTLLAWLTSRSPVAAPPASAANGMPTPVASTNGSLPVPSAPLTPEQMDRIDTLILQLQLPNEEFLRRLEAAFKHRDPKRITAKQGIAIIRALEKELADKEATALTAAPKS